MIQKIYVYDGKIHSKACCDFMRISAFSGAAAYVSWHRFLDPLLNVERGWKKLKVNREQ